MTDNLSPNLFNPKEPDQAIAPILPRSAWNSQLTYLRVLFKAKKALDRIEMESTISQL